MFLCITINLSNDITSISENILKIAQISFCFRPNEIQ